MYSNVEFESVLEIGTTTFEKDSITALPPKKEKIFNQLSRYDVLFFDIVGTIFPSNCFTYKQFELEKPQLRKGLYELLEVLDSKHIYLQSDSFYSTQAISLIQSLGLQNHILGGFGPDTPGFISKGHCNLKNYDVLANILKTPNKKCAIIEDGLSNAQSTINTGMTYYELPYYICPEIDTFDFKQWLNAEN